MPATLDLPAVRRFSDGLNERLRQCDNGEGTVCSNLEESISYYVALCDELRGYVNEWARAVFTGRVAFDPEVEALLKKAAQALLGRAKQVAARGRATEGECFELQNLDALHYRIADFDYLLENWVSPRLSAGPAPRVKLPDAAEQQIIERLEKLPALPSNWRPTNPEQLTFFQKKKAE